jgi:integrase
MSSAFASKFADRIEDFLVLRQALGYSPATYLPGLLHFDRFCQEQFGQADTLTQELVLAWVQAQEGKRAERIPVRARALRLFAQHLNSMGELAYILPSGLVGNRHKSVPYVFTDEELAALFAAADTVTQKLRCAYKSEAIPVLLRLLYTCGLRPCEGRSLSSRNINLNSGEILIEKTKRLKERIVVMSCDMLGLCRDYALVRTLRFPDCELFFPNAFGEAFTTEQLRAIFQWCWKKANPEKTPKELPRARSYDLRHQFASAALNRWLDEKQDLNAMLPYLQAYMGHESLAATAYYIHLLPEKLVKSPGIDWEPLHELIPEVSIWQS